MNAAAATGLLTGAIGMLTWPALAAAGDASVVEAGQAEAFVINAGVTDAWFNPTTQGQGFLITVFPGIQQLFLAWFTYDTERPLQEATAQLGDPGHRWLTAQGPFDGDTAELTVFQTRGGAFDASDPVAETDPVGIGSITLSFSDCSAGTDRYDIDTPSLSGDIPIHRIVDSKLPLCEALWAQELPQRTRPEPDLSHGPENPVVQNGYLADSSKLVDGGPGVDGIPSLDSPRFVQDPIPTDLDAAELVVGVKIGDELRAYPHNILNWDEIVDDSFTLGGEQQNLTLSYCPLTGSAVLWKSFEGFDKPSITFQRLFPRLQQLPPMAHSANRNGYCLTLTTRTTGACTERHGYWESMWATRPRSIR